jgi:hypothetical protein
MSMLSIYQDEDLVTGQSSAAKQVQFKGGDGKKKRGLGKKGSSAVPPKTPSLKSLGGTKTPKSRGARSAFGDVSNAKAPPGSVRQAAKQGVARTPISINLDKPSGPSKPKATPAPQAPEVVPDATVATEEEEANDDQDPVPDIELPAGRLGHEEQAWWDEQYAKEKPSDFPYPEESIKDEPFELPKTQDDEPMLPSAEFLAADRAVLDTPLVDHAALDKIFQDEEDAINAVAFARIEQHAAEGMSYVGLGPVVDDSFRLDDEGEGEAGD